MEAYGDVIIMNSKFLYELITLLIRYSLPTYILWEGVMVVIFIKCSLVSKWGRGFLP